MEVEKMAYSVPECANALGLGLTKMNELVNTKGFPAIRLGRRVVVPVDQLKAWLAKQPTIGSGQPMTTAV